MPPTPVLDADDFTGGKLLVWGIEGIEPNTIEQAHKTARLPFVHSHVALMPDAHVGIGATVGSVIATQGAIVPAAVGVDIGCGCIAAPTNVQAHQFPDNLGPLHGLIRENVPAGMGRGHEGGGIGGAHEWAKRVNQPELVQDSDPLWKRTVSQHGTLGGGNHFVEVCLDETDRVWVLVHSGSRGVGNELAKVHIDGARGLMRRYFIELEDPDLAYFIQGTPEFDAYVRDMLWAQEYARTNREQMMTAVLAALDRFLGWADFDCDPPVGGHHNYTQLEHHHDRDLWVTRKGAIRARVGDVGVIPGSMATGSYIVEGLGNEASFTSAAHGAGRRMSRGQARKTVTETELRTAMAGKVWNDRDARALLDEAPAAYKNIIDVMDAQADLVRVTHTLRQVLNFKGTK